MVTNKNAEVMALRPHHICCMRFWSIVFEERGPAYIQTWAAIKKTILAPTDSPIMAVEGVDKLCRQCPHRRGERCASPEGNEDEVRKWDALILRELQLPYGSCLTSSEWQRLISKKLPFKLCARCHWKQVCSIGAELP